MVSTQAEAIAAFQNAFVHLVNRFQHSPKPIQVSRQTVFQPFTFDAQAQRLW